MEAEVSELLDRLWSLLGVPLDMDTVWDFEETQRRLEEIRPVLLGKRGLQLVASIIVEVVDDEWEEKQVYYKSLEATED